MRFFLGNRVGTKKSHLGKTTKKRPVGKNEKGLGKQMNAFWSFAVCFNEGLLA